MEDEKREEERGGDKCLPLRRRKRRRHDKQRFEFRLDFDGIHARRTLMCGAQITRERERERERGADSIPSGIQSDVKSPASSSSPPTSWWTKPPPSRPPSPPPLERGDLNDRKHARITGGSGTRPPLYLARFKVGETNRQFPPKKSRRRQTLADRVKVLFGLRKGYAKPSVII